MNYNISNLNYLLKKCGFRIDDLKLDIVMVKPGVEGFSIKYQGNEVVIVVEENFSYQDRPNDFVVWIDTRFFIKEWQAIRYLLHRLS